MKYRFPQIKTIDDVLPSLEGRTDFIVMKKDGYDVIDYVYAAPDSFDDIYRRECRGIAFDKNGKIISRPFQKFFNLGEKEETLPHMIDLSQPHHVLSKLDGSMIRPVLVNGELVFMTRKGVTDVALQAWNETKFDKDGMISFIKNGMTPIYEFISPNNKIVIEYDEPRLVLLAIRDNISGEYFDHMDEDIRTGIRFDDPNKISDFVKGQKNIEGFIIRFNNGHMVKIKTEEYLTLHRSIDIFDSEKDMLRLVLENSLDDLLPSLDAKKKLKASEYDFHVHMDIENVANQVLYMLEKAPKETKKDFALYVQSLPYEQPWKTLLFKAYDLKEQSKIVSFIKEYLLRNCSTSSKVEEVTNTFNITRWQ